MTKKDEPAELILWDIDLWIMHGLQEKDPHRSRSVHLGTEPSGLRWGCF